MSDQNEKVNKQLVNSEQENPPQNSLSNISIRSLETGQTTDIENRLENSQSTPVKKLKTGETEDFIA